MLVGGLISACPKLHGKYPWERYQPQVVLWYSNPIIVQHLQTSGKPFLYPQFKDSAIYGLVLNSCATEFLKLAIKKQQDNWSLSFFTLRPRSFNKNNRSMSLSLYCYNAIKHQHLLAQCNSVTAQSKSNIKAWEEEWGGCSGARFLGSASGFLGKSRWCLGSHFHKSGFGVTAGHLPGFQSLLGTFLWSVCKVKFSRLSIV